MRFSSARSGFWVVAKIFKQSCCGGEGESEVSHPDEAGFREFRRTQRCLARLLFL